MKNMSLGSKDGLAIIFIMVIIVVMGGLFVGVMTRGRLQETTAIRGVQRDVNEWSSLNALEVAVKNVYNRDFDSFSHETATVTFSYTGVNPETITVKSIAEHDNYKYGVSQEFLVTYVAPSNQIAPFSVGGWSGSNLLEGYATLDMGNNGKFTGVGGSLNGTLEVLGDAQFKDDSIGNIDLTDITLKVSGSINGSEEGDDPPSDQILDWQGDVTASGGLISDILDKMDTFQSIVDFPPANAVYKKYKKGEPLNLNGQTMVLYEGSSGDVILGNGDKIEVYGSGTLIIQGDFRIGNELDIGESETVMLMVGGNLDTGNNSDFNCDLYVAGNMRTPNNVEISGDTYVMGNLETINNFKMEESLLFVYGYTMVHNNFDIIDSAIMTAQFVAKNNADIRLDIANIPHWLAELASTSIDPDTPRTVEHIGRTGWAEISF